MASPICFLTAALAGGADLSRVRVGVRGVDRQPRVRREAAHFAVGALAQPVGRLRQLHQLGRRGARRSEQLERRLVRAIVVQAPGELDPGRSP